MTVKSMGFIGGGRVTYFLLKRLKKSAVLPEKTIIADPDQKSSWRIKQIRSRSPGRTIGGDNHAKINFF